MKFQEILICQKTWFSRIVLSEDWFHFIICKMLDFANTVYYILNKTISAIGPFTSKVLGRNCITVWSPLHIKRNKYIIIEPFFPGLLLGLLSFSEGLGLTSCSLAIRDFWLLSSTYSTVSWLSSCITLSIPLQTERDHNIETSVSLHISNSHEFLSKENNNSTAPLFSSGLITFKWQQVLSLYCIKVK